MNDIFSKLNSLKSIEPSESWVVESRREVLSKAPVFCDLKHNYSEKSSFYFNFQNLFANKLAFSVFSIILVLFGGGFAVNASKSSLPGDFLYSIKMASENMELAVASEDNKAEIEIKQVGKRVEELTKVSQNHSDINQTEKVAQLLEEIEVKSKNANSHLANLNNKAKVATVAKIANVQSGKYAEVLTKTTGELTEAMKNNVSVEVGKALDSNKKLNFNSLAVMINGITDGNKEEILEKINNEIDQIESEIKNLESSDFCGSSIVADDKNVSDDEGCVENQPSDSQIVLLNEAKEEIKKAKQNLEDNNLLDAMNGVVAVQKIIAELKNSAEADINVDDIIDDDAGSVSGAEDEEINLEINLKEESDKEEGAVLDETPEAAVTKEEADGAIVE